MPSVVVVGSGAAGLSAAVSAADHGADVLVLERAPKKERGGNTFWTEAYFRLKSENELAPNFRQDFMNFSGGRSDPALVDTLEANAIPTLHWVREMGVRFDPTLPIVWLVTGLPRLLPAGGGAAILDALEARALNLGVKIIYERIAHNLKVENGRVVGVEVIDPAGRDESYDASSVILACGGFEGNPEMELEHFGYSPEGLRPFCAGARYDQGDAIEMALRLGARRSGDYANFHASTIDPRSDKANPANKAFSYGVVLNNKGERFIDEGAKSPELMSEVLARALWKQPGSVGYCIVDQGFFSFPRWRAAMRTDQPGIQADSLEDLVEKLPIEDRSLAMKTLRTYNESAKDGMLETPNLDGVSMVADGIPKSNWGYKLNAKPFMAYPIAGSIVFTFGGLAVTTESKVLNEQNAPIPGLFAAGEPIGLYYGSYVGATSVMRGLVFGRIAGRTAAKEQ